MVLFFIRMLYETTGICLALCFQMISNLAEALYLICMFIILQQIVQPSVFYGIGRSGNQTSGVQGTAIHIERISIFRDAVTLLMAAYFVYGIYYPYK